MKLKDGYILREIAGEAVLIPSGQNALEFNGIIALNAISAEIWKLLQANADREQILHSILDAYDVTEEVAAADLDEFLDQLRKLNILDAAE